MPKPAVAEITGAGRECTVSMISELSIPWRVDRGDPEVGVPELALDDDQRHALVSHLDRMGVPELVGRESPPYSGRDGRAAQLLSGRGLCPVSSGCRAPDDAQQRSYGKLRTHIEPWLQLTPCPAIHADLAAAAALSLSHQHRAPGPVQISLGEIERFADPQPSTPEDDDQCAQPRTIGATTGCAHHGHDLLDGRRIRRVALTLVPWRPPVVIARHRGRRPAMTRSVVQNGLHRASFRR